MAESCLGQQTQPMYNLDLLGRVLLFPVPQTQHGMKRNPLLVIIGRSVPIRFPLSSCSGDLSYILGLPSVSVTSATMKNVERFPSQDIDNI